MNVGIGTVAAQFLFCEYVSNFRYSIFAVWGRGRLRLDGVVDRFYRTAQENTGAVRSFFTSGLPDDGQGGR
jgi:hypothetical protein